MNDEAIRARERQRETARIRSDRSGDVPRMNTAAVPIGTVTTILAWVDGDRQRAADALAAESSRRPGSERRTLVDWCVAIVEGEA